MPWKSGGDKDAIIFLGSYCQNSATIVFDSGRMNDGTSSRRGEGVSTDHRVRFRIYLLQSNSSRFDDSKPARIQIIATDMILSPQPSRSV